MVVLVTGLLSIATGIIIFAKPVAGYVSLSILFSIVLTFQLKGLKQQVGSPQGRSKGWVTITARREGRYIH